MIFTYVFFEFVITNHHFFEFRWSPFQNHPKSKMLIFRYTYAKFTSKQMFLEIFRGGLKSSQNGKMSFSFFILFKDPFWSIFTLF